MRKILALAGGLVLAVTSATPALASHEVVPVQPPVTQATVTVDSIEELPDGTLRATTTLACNGSGWAEINLSARQGPAQHEAIAVGVAFTFCTSIQPQTRTHDLDTYGDFRPGPVTLNTSIAAGYYYNDGEYSGSLQTVLVHDEAVLRIKP